MESFDVVSYNFIQTLEQGLRCTDEENIFFEKNAQF